MAAAETQQTVAEIQRLVEPMLKRRLFVCLSVPVGSAEGEFEVLPEHLRHLMDWERRGVLFGGGPFLENGEPGSRAMYILRADSRQDAHALASEEPFHKRGMRTFTIEEWSLNEGRVTLHVDFSTQHGGVDGR